MAALWGVQNIILERKIARWVWMEQRPVTATEIAGQFSVTLNTARHIIHNLMRRADGIRCKLETGPGINSTGHPGIVKYFSVQYLPESYQPLSKKS
ncbi:TPA: hypothetical protein ACIVON_004985 [Salmonella enterica subsp. enterica serovar Poona]|nr:hypothetical protein [Salmonella enterica]EKB5042447.1 hypothetical protein [Salmonella enterica]EME1067522.1 hypothetical protein [Salmonella enterica]HEC8685121.1 hypothetical protein [Salmonella enterica subsp. enterica serovar Oranienburg]HEC9416459.1 hypothetical protein [Salmonella enterica subsp. enterica serovar Poona]